MLDEDEARRATVAAAERLLARRPEVRAIVLECTNMPPYADAVRAATGLPVHDITTLVRSRLGRMTKGAA
jgi:Asp/Glu/hydantoin racemase